MKMFVFILPFIIGIIVFEVVLCMALIKVASINSRQEEIMQSQAELHRQKGAGTIGN